MRSYECEGDGAYIDICNRARDTKKGRKMRPYASFGQQKSTDQPCLFVVVELKAAKTHTVLYQINRTEYYCQIDLPLSDYPLYGKQLVASRG